MPVEYLAYYEVQDILKKHKERDMTVTWDKAAAVKYFSWDNNQWISYDDADTFKQKKDWVNGIGFSGSLIWASDLDDYNNTAHKAFTGNNNIGSRYSLQKVENQKEYTDTADSFLGQGCKFNETVTPNVSGYDCGDPDMELIGYDAHGCKGDGKKVSRTKPCWKYYLLTDYHCRSTKTGSVDGPCAVLSRHA